MVVNPDVDVGFNSDNDIFLNILLLILVLSIVAKMLQNRSFYYMFYIHVRWSFVFDIFFIFMLYVIVCLLYIYTCIMFFDFVI